MTTGDFITFVDDDDTIAQEMITKLYHQLIEEHSEIECCLYYRIDKNGTFYFINDKNNPQQNALQGTYAVPDWIQTEAQPLIILGGVTYNLSQTKLYKRSLFQNVE